jgi:dihydrodipicolinate synthase/N-acetylneuraminate lyase
MSEPRFPRGIMATCCVPWDESFRFMEDVFRRHVRATVRQTPLVYIFGTAGEGYAVDRSQFETIVRVFVEEMRSAGAEPMVGVISLSPGEAHQRIEYARGLGVRRFLFTLPSWEPCTPAETEIWFEQICGRRPDCQFLHYNLMRAGRLVQPEEYARLVLRHENLVATKNASDSMSFLRRLMTMAPQLRHFIVGPGFPAACLFGPAGLLIAMESMNWSTARGFYDAAVAKDADAAFAMSAELRDVLAHMMSMSGFRGNVDGAFDKVFAKFHVRDFPLRVLPPYEHPDDALCEAFIDWLREHYPHWAPE